MSQALFDAVDGVNSLTFCHCPIKRLYVSPDVFNIDLFNNLNSVSLTDIPIMQQVPRTMPGGLHHSHGSVHFNLAFVNLTYKSLQLVHEVCYT